MRRYLGLALASLVLVSSAAQAADDEGVDVTFVDNGGVMYKIRPPAFTFNLDPERKSEVPANLRNQRLTAAYGEKTTTAISVPRSDDWPVRNGCFARTVSIPIAHGRGKVQAFPEIDVDWSTTVRDPDAPRSDDSLSPPLARKSSSEVMEETLLRMQLEVRRANGTRVYGRAFITPGILDLSPETQRGSAITYRGKLRQTGTGADDKTIGLVDVREGDEVRFSLCDVRPDAKVTLKSVRILSYPVSSN